MNPDEGVELEDASVTEAVAALLSELPKPVQDFVTGPERARIALSLSQKYNLHADQAGEFEHAYMFMLLGVSSPEEFVDTLTKAGIPLESVRGLAKDVNEQVFVPLRQAEQRTRQSQPKPETLLSGRGAQTLLPGSSEPVPAPPTALRGEPASQGYQRGTGAQPVSAPLIPPPSLVPPPYMMPSHVTPQMMYPAPGTPIYMWSAPPLPVQGEPVPPAGQLAAPNVHTETPAPIIPKATPEPVHTPGPIVRPSIAPKVRPAPVPLQNTTPTPPLASDSDPYREPVM